MEKIGLNELRAMFRQFYEAKGHYPQKSFSLVPDKDKSLLLINSGMAPLKPFFAGLETPPSVRMTTCQKCIRTGDIENVGLTSRHGTFFEMLGSFSFGDYFKEQSLKWGWEFITEVLKMPEDKIWATVYEDDDEAVEIWKNVIGMPEDRIVRLGKEDNFWEIGAGPCGPCSEIYFDRGPEYGCDSEDCKPGCECDRYIEFWNHVFTQFNRDEAGNYTPLAHPNIDTGMGLERLACVMQDVDSIFDIDTIRSTLDEVVKISGVAYCNGEAKTDVSIRIITDHIRSVTFMVGDGIVPGNEGRGYVLRRLLRRAARHGKILGIREAFLHQLVVKVIEVSGDAYPEIQEKQDYILKVVSAEEQKFRSTIDQGMVILSEYIAEVKAAGKTLLSGEQVFKLYDTYGFPLELTQEMAEEEDCAIDEEGFQKHMEHQRKMARDARKEAGEEGWKEGAAVFSSMPDTEFTGYTKLIDDVTVLGVFKEQTQVAAAEEGDSITLVLDKTPLYGESGGQASDSGVLKGEGFEVGISNVTRAKGVFLHHGEVVKGVVSENAAATAFVNTVQRNRTAANHTATHLLHKALKEIVGVHVDQAGSSVTADALRFDFSHFEAVSPEALAQIEKRVNEQVACFSEVRCEEMALAEAQKKGAVSLFSDKYKDVVRVVSVGDYSMELCGGTHVQNSGQIGCFKIQSEAGVASGVRRIEAITGVGVYEKLTAESQLLSDISKSLKTTPANLSTRISALSEELKACKKELEKIKAEAIGSDLGSMVAEAKEINGVKLVTRKFIDCDIADLRNLSDGIKAAHKGVVMVFAAENGPKVTLMVSVTDDLLDKGYHAGNMIKQIAAAAGGGGGGKADMAQAGAKDPAKIPDAFAVAETLL